MEGGLWECEGFLRASGADGELWAVGEVLEGRRGQRGLWVGGVYERGVSLGCWGVGFSRWDAGGGSECRRA